MSEMSTEDQLADWRATFPGKSAQDVIEMLDKAQKERDELQSSFDLRWNADMRAIERWRQEKPEERELSWPDHADLVVWLLGKLDQAEIFPLETGECGSLWCVWIASRKDRYVYGFHMSEKKTVEDFVKALNEAAEAAEALTP